MQNTTAQESANNYIGRRIREKRRAAYVSQQSLGDAVNLSQAMISFIENGKATLSMTMEVYDELVASNIFESRTPGGAYRVGRLKP